MPFGVAHTYVAYIREYPPDYFLLEGFNIRRFKLLSLLRTRLILHNRFIWACFH